jgi:hypothetical protein
LINSRIPLPGRVGGASRSGVPIGGGRIHF